MRVFHGSHLIDLGRAFRHLFGIGFGIFMALQPEDAIALRSRGRYTQVPEPTEEYIRLTRLEGIVVSVLCAVLLVVLLFAPT